MNFAFSDEQHALRAETRRFLADHVDARALSTRADAHDHVLWKRLAELGWFGMLAPEDAGGGGWSVVDATIAFEEAGRALVPASVVQSVLAGALLASAAGGDTPWLGPLISGEVVYALTDGAGLEIDGDHVHGTQHLVLCADAAHRLVIDPGDAPPLMLERTSFSTETMATVDPTRPRSAVRIDGRGERLAQPAAPRLRSVARALRAAEAVGSASAALGMAAEYAKTRIQFGKPIGSFQAVKHKLADMARSVEAARLATYYAAWASDGPDGTEAELASITATTLAHEALLRCAEENIQIHGGIGVTWEHDAHLYYRRARAMAVELGSPADGREHMARAVLDGTAMRERA